MFVYLFVCLYLIQIHISEPIRTKLCIRLPLGLEETVGYVWAWNSGPLRPFGPFFLSGHKMADGESVFRDTVVSVVPAGVRVTSPTLRCRWQRSHPRQSYIRDSTGSSPYILADNRVFRYSILSLILVGVRVTSQILRSTGRRGPPATGLYPSF
jgi:hypothetical protein